MNDHIEKTNKGRCQYLRFNTFTHTRIISIYVYLLFRRSKRFCTSLLTTTFRLCFVVYCLQTFTELVSSADHRLSTENKHSPSTAVHITYHRRTPKQSRLCLFVYLLGHGESETKFRQLTV